MILVTGANGLLGANVIAELLDSGYTVRGLLRRVSDYRGKPHPRLELVGGGFTDGECLRRVMPGCKAVIHTAAETSRSGRHYSEYYEVNVRGTRRLVESAIEHGIGRFIAVTTSDSFGYGPREIPGCELNEMSEPFASSYYSRSKYESLNAALSYRDRIGVVGIAPTCMLGPLDSKPGSGRIILGSYGRRVIFCPPGGRNFVHAGDVARGIVRALERGVSGETYLLCSENLTYKEFYKRMNGLSGGRAAVYITVPSLLLYLAGGAGSCLRALGIRTCISLPNMRILCTAGYYHNYKATRDLGMDFRSVEDAVSDAVEWFASEKMLRL